MGTKHFEQLKPFLALAVFLLLWWLCPLVFKRFLKVGLYELQAPVQGLYSHLKDLQNYWLLRSLPKEELLKLLRDEARASAHTAVQLQQLTTYQEELTRLEALLKLPRKTGYHYEIARVIRRELSSWEQQLIINKGRDYKIKAGAGVIYAGGVAGIVKEVYSHTSLVELITSPHFRMVVCLEKEAAPLTFKGTVSPPFVPPLGKLLNVPKDTILSPEDPQRLVSSRLGGVFPDGLTVGHVKQLALDSNGLFMEGLVALPKDLLNLQEVTILMPEAIQRVGLKSSPK